jgi:hypothetical protein
MIPDTPAGRVLSAWLDAFNSGDRARVSAYHARHEPHTSAAQTLTFRRRTGGFELVEIAPGEDPLHLAFRVRERASPKTAVGQLAVDEGEEVVTFELRQGDAPLTAPIDAAARSRVVEGIAAALVASYVDEAQAEELARALRSRLENGDYDALHDGHVFAARLTAQLRALGDRHLHVYCGEPEPPAGGGDLQSQLWRENCGFEKLERLDGNIGYLKLNFFGPPAICAPTAAAAMNFLAHVDALIFDLRDNTGGDPRMVAWLASYLFDARTHLSDLWERQSQRTTELWTTPDVPGEKLARQPVYVLTSKDTFSGAEELAYSLQRLGRAIIVGEASAGAAHLTAARRIERFVIGIPIARAVNPISGSNWEGQGVQPDVPVAADEALEVAKKLAAGRIRE